MKILGIRTEDATSGKKVGEKKQWKTDFLGPKEKKTRCHLMEKGENIWKL